MHRSAGNRSAGICAIVVTLLLSGGCVRRSIEVTSDPEGALVFMNDQEIGRTPFERDFTWYGVYDVQVRKDGYETLNTEAKVIAPWWQWPPIDFFAEFFRLHDRQKIHFELDEMSCEQVDTDAILGRATRLRATLGESRRENP